MKKTFIYISIGILTIIGVLSVWFKFFLSEHDEFKNSTIFEHHKNISTDGPYILYKNDSLRFIQVNKIENKFELTDILIPKDKNDLTVNTFSYDNSKCVFFNVTLKDSLVVPKSTYPESDSIFVVSDIEGNFYAFHKLLTANKIIDNNCNWSFGKGHLVLVGDFVDRGLNVTQCLWLIYKLEQQAIAQGGNVHFVIGNHELMNLKGNTVHVRTKYKKLANKLKLNYSTDLYGLNSELGRWLRTKNCITKIGNLLFMHAGISKEYLDLHLSIEKTNQIVRDNIDFISTDTISKIVNGADSPFWSREMGHGQSSGTSKILSEAKKYYNFSALIIGHSTVFDIYQQYDNSLINVDVHFPHTDMERERGKALFIESGIRYKVDDFGNKIEI
jgi:hypothetical protein